MLDRRLRAPTKRALVEVVEPAAGAATELLGERHLGGFLGFRTFGGVL